MELRHVICLLALGILAGCASDKHRRAADAEVFAILNQRSQDVLGEAANPNVIASQTGNDPESVPPSTIIRERYEDGGRKLTLPQALDLAVQKNRSYQLQRETAYLSALSLTGTRHKFIWQAPKATGELGFNRRTDGDLRGDSDADLSVEKLFKTGASVTATLANDLVLYLDGKPKVPDFTLKLTQPLMRGAGAEIAAEVLTQAERDVVYAVRAYSHYQKPFAIETVPD